METESESSTVAIDDLVSEQIGSEPSGSEPAAQPETPEAQVVSGDTPAAEPSPQTQEVVQSEPNAQVSEPPTPQSYQIGDKTYTAQELQAALISAQQLPHLQGKYVNLLEQAKQQAQQPATVPQNQPQMAPQAMLAQIRAKYDPIVQQGVKDGTIEADFATLFPAMAAQMLMYRDGFMNLSQQVSKVDQVVQSGQRQTQSQGLLQGIGQTINNLAQSGEAFAPLKEPQQVQGFMKYLWDMDFKVDQVRNPDFLARQWVAYNRDMYLQSSINQQNAQNRANQLRLSRPDGISGARTGTFQAPEKSPLDMMIEDHLSRAL